MQAESNKELEKKPSLEEAKAAITTLLKYLGENTEREGLKGTPNRIIESYKELFSGYTEDPEKILSKRFKEVSNFDDIVLLKKIKFHSFCEHHFLPFSGYVDVAYFPNGFVVGISKIARIVDIFAKRLQIQERLTAQIADIIDKKLTPLGVAVRVSALHSCMSMRGVLKEQSSMETSHYTGIFKQNFALRQEFLNLIIK